MDARTGECWSCKNDQKDILCDVCTVARYCSDECREKDRHRHSIECDTAVKMLSCGACGTRDESFIQCSGCYFIVYCSENCQRTHWSEHKYECKRTRRAIVSEAKYRVNMSSYTYLPWYIGNSIAEDYLYLKKNEGERPQSSVRLLFVGLGDIRHVIRTLTDIPVRYQCQVHFVLSDSSPHVMARNLFLIYCALTQPDIEIMLQIWYSIKLSPACFKYLVSMLDGLTSQEKDEMLLRMHKMVDISEHHWDTCRDIWLGWLSLALNPEAANKLAMVRFQKLSRIDAQKELLALLQTIPAVHKRSMQDFMKRGLLLPLNSKLRKKCIFGNPTMACFNPLNPVYENRYPDLNAQIPRAEGWSYLLSSKDEMIYGVRDDAHIFSCWDYLQVKEKSGFKKDIIEMYYTFLKSVFELFCHNLKKHKVKFRLILDDYYRMSLYLTLKEKFDRIVIDQSLNDYQTTPVLLRQFAPLLNRINPCSVLITQHENWVHFSGMKDLLTIPMRIEPALEDIRHRSDVLPGLNNCQTSNALISYSVCQEDYFDFYPFFFTSLLAEILAFRHTQEEKPLDKSSQQHPSEMAAMFALQLRDFRLELNCVVPFRREGNIRRVSLQRNYTRCLEWVPFNK